MTQLYMDPHGRLIDTMGNVVQPPPGMVPVPVGQAPAPAGPATGGGWLRQDVAGMPVWALLLGLTALGGGGYYLFTRAKAKAMDGDDDDGVEANPPSSSGGGSSGSSSSSSSGSNWAPSRSRTAEQVKKWLKARNADSDVREVFEDADDALSKGVKNPSPLINLKVKGNAKLHEDENFRRWARRQGLNPVRIDRTTVGLVPADNTKRGAEWESYVDALREEGQKV